MKGVVTAVLIIIKLWTDCRSNGQEVLTPEAHEEKGRQDVC